MATQSGLPILKEVRFAVVMYGGVSLAIYINGVAQELLKMVRATARKEDGTYLIPSPDPSTPELDKNNVLSGTEIVYRQIGKELNAKFVIDILSGTSAGGINAVYLAKALVNDQSLDPLKSMWVKEGDIALFVNDKQSTRGLPRNLARLLNQKPRTSLLNSQRMYYKLLEALDQMENQPSVPVSPYVDMLDLFVTATDLQGLYSAIRISQQNVYELRYRSVFHFEYSTKDIHDRSQADLRVQRNDFSRRFNPFLAFVARCTSSFPFAFEPMTLADIEDILNSSTFYSVYKYEPDKWKLFFEDYLRKEKVTPLAGEQKEAEIGKAIDRFAQRPFGDGGYLDNKPFSYATNAILSRQGMLPVDRKLFYIEPSPEHPEEDRLNRERPDAFANVFSALLALPRYETIREDLQLISEHNRVVRRLRGTTELAMKAIFENGKIQKFWHQSAQRKEAWEKKTLQEMIAKYGVGYGVYHQLRVTQVTHDLGTLVTQVLGSEEESDLWKQCRSVLKTWREGNYAPNPGKGEATENEFLYKLDISWRIRRLRFLLYLLDKLFDNKTLQQETKEIDAPTIFAYSGIKVPRSIQTTEYREALCAIKMDLNSVVADLNQRLHNSPVEEFIQSIQKENSIAELMDELAEYIHEALRDARKKTEDALGRDEHTTSKKDISEPSQALQACLSYYFDLFEYFDLMTYPIQYGTPLGGVDEVDVWRISPEDAKSIVNEVDEKQQKLMGTKLGNFGGFFDEEWRLRDILWGRLDGAERIITALLSGTDLEKDLPSYIQKANVAILREELLGEHDKASTPLIDALSRITEKIKKNEIEIPKPPSQIKDSAKSQVQTETSFDRIVLKMGTNTIKAILRDSLPDNELLEIFKRSQQADEYLKPEPTLALAGRAAQVMAGVLENLSTNHTILKKRTAWIYRLGQVVWSIVQIAIPDSFLNILFRRWIAVFYIVAIVIITMGRVGNPDLISLGWKVLGTTAAIHLTILTFSSYLRGKQIHVFLKNVLVSILIACMALLVFIGLSHFNQDILKPLTEFIR